MHIMMETDYALRITHILSAENAKLEARIISEMAAVPLRFSLKILRKLVVAGIVKSYKGSKGGYEIAKSPEDISVYDVISAMQGPIRINRCAEQGHECRRIEKEKCPYHWVFKHVSDQMAASLSICKISDILKRAGALPGDSAAESETPGPSTLTTADIHMAGCSSCKRQ